MTRRWDTWWSNYFFALGVLSILAGAGLGWLLSQRAASSVFVGSDVVLVVVAIYGVAALINVGLGLWIRRGSTYAWYVGMGFLALSVLLSLAAGASGAISGGVVSGIGLVLGYLAREEMLGSGAEPTAAATSSGPRDADYEQVEEHTVRPQEHEQRNRSQPANESRRQQRGGGQQQAGGTAPTGGGRAQSTTGRQSQPQSQTGTPDPTGTGSADGTTNDPAETARERATEPSGDSAAAGGGGREQADGDDDTKFCPYCGDEIPERAGHCPYCSSSVS
jgi:hypothetical protein